MTTPHYTSAASPEAEALGLPSVDALDGARASADWWARASQALRRAWRPWVVRTGLDLAAIGFIAAAFAQAAVSAEFLFHCVFVLLVLHAFMFGLRGTLIRIALVSVPLAVFAEARFFGLNEPPLELTEWPLMFVIAILVAWMADRLSATSRRYAALFRQASERLLTVEEDERRRIAGELHDGVGQVLTALTLTLDAAGATTDPQVAQRRVTSARALADTALAGTRDLSHRIRPARLEERGLVAAVRDLATQSGFRVAIHADPSVRDAALLGPTATIELYRIIQEALANAARHSGADGARVSISHAGDRLNVVVSDQGRGFDPAQVPDTGIGLAGMLERARLLGGRLSLDSTPGAGTRVSVSLPFEPADASG